MASPFTMPDIAGTLGPLMQMEGVQRRNAFEEDRMRRADEADARDRAAGDSLPAALTGDKGAQAKVMASPRLGLQLQAHLERMDTTQRAKLKEAADWQTQAAMGVLNAPPEQRVAAYQTAMDEGRARGYDLGRMPAAYTPAVEGMLRYHVSRAEPIAEYFKRQSEQPQPMGPGGAPPAGAPGPGGNDLDRSRAAISGLESRGKYDAVGPDIGKGARAYGRYQIMDFNIPEWTREILGKPMTPQEFIANPQAQDAVFNAKFGQYVKQFGSPEAAARAWFAGPGGMNNPNAKDALGTSVSDYAAKFNAGMGGPQLAQAGGPPMVPGMPPQGGGESPGMPGPRGNVVAPGPGAPDDPVAALRTMALPQGVRFVGKNGVPMINGDRVLVQMPDNTRQWVPMPPKKEPGAGGPFAGTGMEQQATNILITGDPASPEYAAAYAHMAAPRTTVNEQGQMVTIQPNVSHFRPPTFSGMGPGPVAPPGAPGTAPTSQPGGQTVTVTQGRGRPIPGTENETISKNVTAIEKIDKALDVMKNPTADAQPSGRAAGFIARNGGQVGDLIAQEVDPKGVKARALLSDINSQLLLARSGAAVTEGEFKRLVSLLPSASDKPEVITQKLAEVRDYYASILKGQSGQYTRENGFIPHEGAQRVLGGAATPATAKAGGDRERLLFDARKAIEQGAPRDAVMQRLKENGVEGGL